MDGLSELVGQLDSCYPVDHASVGLAQALIPGLLRVFSTAVR